MKILARKAIRDLKPYQPGKPIKELERELGIKEKDIIKLASNENPLGPSPAAVAAILKAVRGINRYPDGNSFCLKSALSRDLKLSSDNIVLGNGSDELIDIIIKAFMENGQEAVISRPSFLEYEIILRTYGCIFRQVPMLRSDLDAQGLIQRFSYDIDGILGSIGPKTKLIFIGNPDNPTGAYLTKSDIKVFLKRCPKDVIVVFDEAYRELVDRKDYADPSVCIKSRNIIVLRTFSKAYGLAGLRIGYAMADKGLSGWMERVRQPFNVNMLAQVAAEAALSDKRHISRTRALISTQRRYIVKQLKGLGLKVIEGPANFLLLSSDSRTGTDIFKRLLRYGVIIRDMSPYGLKQWARVNVGTVKENRRFIATLKRIL